jgi:ADP-ribose pyrophosphatase
MDDVQVVARQVLFDHPAARIVIDTLEIHGKRRRHFYLASPVEAVATVGLTPAGEILLTRQYRHPIQRVIYDLPAGRLNPGEAPIDGARREFEEETGYYPRSMQPLGYFNQFPGTLRAGTHLFFASDLLPTAQRLDEGEELEVEAVSVADLIARIVGGEFVDGSLQLGVLLAWQKGYLTAA